MGMSKNLYVGNLAFLTTSDDLREVFGAYAAVDRVQVVTDRDTGRSRGLGFVEMRDGGTEAVAARDGAEDQGRNLTGNEAKPREQRPAGGYGRR
jgi:RNA recognition motif-containing protein